MLAKNNKVTTSDGKGNKVVGFIIKFYGELDLMATLSTAPFGKGEILGQWECKDLIKVS